MTDLAQLVLSVDSSSVPRAVASLDGLTAAGTRAEAASIGLGGGFKGAAAEGAAMAAAAQASARAAMDQAAGFGVATKAAQVNTMALRESLVVAREISRGNFTRLPGSLTLLAQGIGSQGGFSAFASAIQQQLGLMKTLQNAELAEAAAAAASSAAGVEAAARRAAANVMAVDTEIALAEAQIRVAEGTGAEAAAQARLAAAHEAVAVAAAEASVAENALGAAMGRSTAAGAASAAETTTVVTALGATLGAAALAAGVLSVAFVKVKEDADAIDPSAKQFISTLGLTHAEINRLKDTTVTWGDVVHGTFNALVEDAGSSSASISSAFHEAFVRTAKDAVDLAAGMLGSFAAAVKGIHTLLGDAGTIGTNLASAWHGGGAINTKALADPGADAVAQFNKTYGNTEKFFDNDAPGAINRARDARLRDQAGNLIDRRNPKRARKGAVDHADDTIARLDEEILAAKLKLAGGAAEQASLQMQQIDVEKKKTIEDAQSLLKQHRITAGEEQHIELQANVLDDLKKQAVLREEATKLLTQQQEAQDQLFGFQTDALKFADEMATSSADHRTIQLEMLDIAYKQRAFDLQILESKELLAHDYAKAALTQNEINNLPVQQARAAALVAKNTADPLQQWLDKVPHDAKTITDALKGIEANGLDSLANSIAGVVTGTESLGQAFRDISHQIIGDIIQMTVKMLIFKAISSIFGAPSGGLNLGSAPFGIGGGAFPGLATGGPIMAGETRLIGENGPELFRPSQSGTVIPNGHMGAANSNQSSPLEVVIRTEPSDDAWAKVTNISANHAGQAVKVSVDHTNQTIRSIARPKLMGGR